MAIDFPSNPKKGDTHIGGGIEFVFDGASWKIPDPLAEGGVTADKLLTADSGDAGDFLQRTAAGMAWASGSGSNWFDETVTGTGGASDERNFAKNIPGVGASAMSYMFIHATVDVVNTPGTSTGASADIGDGTNWVEVADLRYSSRGRRRRGNFRIIEFILVGNTWWVLQRNFRQGTTGTNRIRMGEARKDSYPGRSFTQIRLRAAASNSMEPQESAASGGEEGAMPITFPNSPAAGDVRVDGGRRFQYDGSVWNSIVAGSATIGSVTAPQLAGGEHRNGTSSSAHRRAWSGRRFRTRM